MRHRADHDGLEDWAGLGLCEVEVGRFPCKRPREIRARWCTSRVAGIASQELQAKVDRALARKLSAFAVGVAGAHELHQRSTDPSAKILRRGFSIYAGECPARGASAESE